MKLPPPIAAYFQAANAHNTEALNAVFTDDARVTDEGQEYRGAAIKGWIDKVNAEYKPHLRVIEAAETRDEIVVTVQVSGTFPGSPIELRFNFTLEHDKIAALTIGD